MTIEFNLETLFDQTTYRANGKLLLTGEYLVLHGAKAIALPLKVGQQLVVSSESDSKPLSWKAYYEGKIWFDCQLNPTDFSVIKTSNLHKAELLRKIFQSIQILNPDFSAKAGTKLDTVLEANPEWGFGSSSTLISLLAQWSGVDPYRLNELIFKGSGFDIACATASGPVFYIRNKPTEPISLDYPFANQLFFIYSGQKKETLPEVKTFLNETRISSDQISEVSALTDEFANCQNLDEFNRLVRQHETLVGKIIGKTSLKSEYYSDFKGEIKSLGAWGGDFFLASTELSFLNVKEYFANKGLTTLFHWSDLILKRQKS